MLDYFNNFAIIFYCSVNIGWIVNKVLYFNKNGIQPYLNSKFQLFLIVIIIIIITDWLLSIVIATDKINNWTRLKSAHVMYD